MRTCLVTGGSLGIGKEVARALARRGNRVILACRDPARGEAARKEIAEATANPAVELGIVELGRPGSIRELARGMWANRRRETRTASRKPGPSTSWATSSSPSKGDPRAGADTVVWLASDPEVEGKSGEFWIDRQKVRCRFRDTPAEERLWALCASMTRAAG